MNCVKIWGEPGPCEATNGGEGGSWVGEVYVNAKKKADLGIKYGCRCDKKRDLGDRCEYNRLGDFRDVCE